MDPNETLTAIRCIIRAAELDDINGDRDNEGANLVALTELVTALDEWLSTGGFLPTDWQTAGKDHWVENESYPVRDWQNEVANNDTRLGYAAWVANNQTNKRGRKRPMIHPHILDAMFDGAITALLWSENDDDGEPYNRNYGVVDIHPNATTELWEAIVGLVFTIPNETMAMLDFYAGTDRGREWPAGELFGHDFTLSSNGHGVGFWDRGAGELGDRIHAMCVSEYNLYQGDDGKLYIS